MTKVAILPVATPSGEISYHALAGGKQSYGATAGAALDALSVQLEGDEDDTLVVVQRQRPDGFFDQAKQRRLAELMTLWRCARDSGSALPPGQQAELDRLIEAEIEASARRTAAMLHDLAG